MIKQNIKLIRERIAQISDTCARKKDSIRLVAVSKRFPTAVIQEAQHAGHLLFGENYLQEAQKKYLDLHGKVEFHFIGHLQSNKAKIAAEICTMVETVDSIKLAKNLHKYLLQSAKSLDILVQVNIGDDKNKSGVDPEQTEALLRQITEYPTLHPLGLMTMPPFTEDPEDSRPFFRELRLLAEKLSKKQLFYDNDHVELSMGMSNDYHVAIEEGATLIRIGTAIFGQRSPRPQSG